MSVNLTTRTLREAGSGESFKPRTKLNHFNIIFYNHIFHQIIFTVTRAFIQGEIIFVGVKEKYFTNNKYNKNIFF